MFITQWFLLRAKILYNSFKEDKKRFIFRDLWHTLITLGGLALFYVFLSVMFDFVESRGLPAFDFIFVFLSFILLVFLPLIFYSTIVCSLSFLFQKEEIHFYFSLPVSRLSVFSVKLFQTYFNTIWMVFLGLMTFLAAVQNHFKVTPMIYLTGGVSFLVYFLIPVCLAVILVVAVSRVRPFVQAKGVLTVIGLLVGSILVVVLRMMRPEQLVNAEGKMRLVTFVHSLYKPWMTILPSEWVTNILYGQIQRDFKGVIFNFLSLLILASLLLAFLYIMARSFYSGIWADSVLVGPWVKKKFTWQMLLKIFPVSMRAFIRKDVLSFYRDTVEKGSLLILIPLAVVYLYSLHMLNRQTMSVAGGHMFSFLFIFLFNLFYASVVVAGLCGRWVFPALSAEGNNFKLVRGSSVPLEDFLKAKFLLGFIPFLFLSQILNFLSSLILRFKFSFLLLSAFITGILCYGIVLIAMISGIRNADFSISVPLDFALSSKGFMCLVFEMAFVFVVVGLAALPLGLFMQAGPSKHFIAVLTAVILLFSIIMITLRKIYRTSLIGLAVREV